MIWLALLLSCTTRPDPAAEPPPTRVCRTEPLKQSADPFTILWGGDTLLGDAAKSDLATLGFEWPFAHIQPLLEGADASIFNAEGPVTTLTAKHIAKMPYHYNVDPLGAAAMAASGLTIAGMANNHAMDRGPAGLVDTKKNFKAVGIETFGAGLTMADALKPAIIETPHGRVGVVGFTKRYLVEMMASPTKSGVTGLTEKRARRVAASAREAGVDHLAAFVHWGENYSEIEKGQRNMAGWLRDAGFDLVVGHGPHVPQVVDPTCGQPVAYSIGNLVFGTPGRFTEEFPGYGIILRTEVGAEGFQAIEANCIQTDNKRVKFQPRPCEGEEAERVLKGFLPGAVIEGNKARLEL